jgi:macrodomain Ter protein organizer (MatP/YcbG family)
METEYQRLCRIAKKLGIDITESIMQLCEEARRLGYINGFANAISTTEKE